MAHLIDKSVLVAEIERKIRTEQGYSSGDAECGYRDCAKDILSFLDTIEVKDANEALRVEYEKGRADVIADTLSWLENCWRKYCSNQTIIEGFKEAIKEE